MLKKNTTLFLFLICFTFYSQAQSKQIDSLKFILTNKSLSDTTRVNILNGIALNYYSLNKDSLKYFLEKASELSIRTNYTKGEAYSKHLESMYFMKTQKLNDAIQSSNESLLLYESIGFQKIAHVYLNLGKIYKRKRDTTETKNSYLRGIEIARKHNQKTLEAAFYNNLGLYYVSLKNNYKLAIINYKKSIETYENSNSPYKITAPLNNIANIYGDQGKYIKAIAIFKRCLEINRKLNKKSQIGANLINLSSYYSYINDNDKAIKYAEEAMFIFKKLNQKQQLSYIYINLGNTYQTINNFSKALDYFKKAQIISKEIKDDHGLYYCYYNLGFLQYEESKFLLAEENLNQALDFSIKLNDNFIKCETLLALAELYFETKKINLSLKHTLKAKIIATSLNLTDKQKEVHALLSKIYNQKKQYKKAYENQLLFKTLSDSLFNKETIEKISQIEAEYKYKEERENANKRELKLTQKVKVTTKNLEKSQKKLFLGIILFLLTSILLLAGLFFFKIRHIKAKNENILTEQKLLRSQMTPHFIFNSLAVLQGIILNKEEKKSVSYLSKFSKLLRIILENSRDSIVLLSEELKAIENYLALQNIHNSEKPYKYKIEINSSIDKENYYIPPMLIQPFIENAVEHAFIEKNENKEIHILINLINDELICTISDNGIGINTHKKKTKNSKKSLATIITSERLTILSKKYKTKGYITIENRNKYNKKGTRVTINIPYQLKY